MSKFGQRNSKASKLTPSLVIEIRRLYAESNVSQGQLSRDYGISIGQIGRIVRGESWQSLPATMPTKEEMALTAQKMLSLQNTLKTETEAEKMIREIAEEREKHPDSMLNELSKEPQEEREATAAELKAFELGAALPPHVRLPKGLPE